jgi:ribonuclease G
MIIEIERALKRLLSQHERLRLVVHPEVERFMQHIDRSYMKKLAEKSKGSLEFGTNDQLHLNEYQFYNANSGKKLEV